MGTRMILTVKLAEGHVKLVNVQLAVAVSVIVADHVAQIASRAQLLHVLLPGDLHFRDNCRLSASYHGNAIRYLAMGKSCYFAALK